LVPDVSRQQIAFFFKGENIQEITKILVYGPFKKKPLLSLEMLGLIYEMKGMLRP
jgi:hypothetical protein